MDCKVAHKFLAEFPDCKFLGSEDLIHVEEIKNSILEGLNLLYKKGWKRIEAIDLGFEES